MKGEGLPAAGDTSAAAAARLGRIVEQMDARHKPVRFFESHLARGLVYFDGANLVLTDLSGPGRHLGRVPTFPPPVIRKGQQLKKRWRPCSGFFVQR